MKPRKKNNYKLKTKAILHFILKYRRNIPVLGLIDNIQTFFVSNEDKPTLCILYLTQNIQQNINSIIISQRVCSLTGPVPYFIDILF